MTIPDSVTIVGQEAFYYCSCLDSVKMGNNIASIGDSAFSCCTSLTTVTIPDSVTFIGNSAFRYCSGLTSVTIGNSVMTIGIDAFRDCTSLMGFYFRGNVPNEVWGSLLDIWREDIPTAYFLSETTGWGSWFYGLPTFLWNPQVKNDATFGVKANCFGFTFTNAGSPTVVIEACTNLASPAWIPVATNTLTGGSSHFGDADWTNHPCRFYRFRMP